MKNVFGINRHCRPQRRGLLEKLRGTSGAIDLASIMVGVLVISIIGGVIAATVFAVIPWSQDNAARSTLASVRTAQNVAQVREGRFLDIAKLVDAGYLPRGSAVSAVGPAIRAGFRRGLSAGTPNVLGHGQVAISVNAAGSCYVAATQSATGYVFWADSASTPVGQLAPGDSVPALQCSEAATETNGVAVPATPVDFPAASQFGIVPAAVPADGASGSHASPWAITDPDLEADIRRILGKASGGLTIGDALSLTSLTGLTTQGGSGGNHGIQSLGGLEKATNLVELDLASTQVTDLSPIAGLTKLNSLRVDFATVSDAAPIARLTALQTLRLEGSGITDISALRTLTSLQDLSLGHVRDIATALSLPALKTLSAESPYAAWSPEWLATFSSGNAWQEAGTSRSFSLGSW